MNREPYELISYKGRTIKVIFDSDYRGEDNDGWHLKAILDGDEDLYDWYTERERMQILDAAIEQNKLVNQD